MALDHPGDECMAALANNSLTSTPPDHGGEVYKVGNSSVVDIHLQGIVDAESPFTSNNQSDSGSFFVCLADKSEGKTGWTTTPTVDDYVFYDHVHLNVVHQPPSPPPPSPPPATPPAIQLQVDANAGPVAGNSGDSVGAEHNTLYELGFTGNTVEVGDSVLFVSAAHLNPTRAHNPLPF